MGTAQRMLNLNRTKMIEERVRFTDTSLLCVLEKVLKKMNMNNNHIINKNLPNQRSQSSQWKNQDGWQKLHHLEFGISENIC